MRKTPTFKSEEEFAEVIVKWLKKNGWEVYQEVQMSSYSSVADIVAKKDNKYWIIECKLNFGFKVMAQADGWKNCANYISVAVPYPKYSHFREKICKLLNIGVISVVPYYNYCYDENNRIDEHGIRILIPRIERKCSHKYLINSLTERHKTFAKAGNNSGSRITPFKLTVEALVKLVEENNGILLKEAIKKIKHHYANDRSANGSLAKFIDTDIIKELYLDRTKEGNRVYLKEEK